eukprot:3941316-Rhodomonas_salina.6
MRAAADFVHIFSLYSSNWIEVSFKIIGTDILTNKICTLVFHTLRSPLEVLKFCTWKERIDIPPPRDLLLDLLLWFEKFAAPATMLKLQQG